MEAGSDCNDGHVHPRRIAIHHLVMIFQGQRVAGCVTIPVAIIEQEAPRHVVGANTFDARSYRIIYQASNLEAVDHAEIYFTSRQTSAMAFLDATYQPPPEVNNRLHLLLLRQVQSFCSCPRIISFPIV